jgi:DNA-binding NtrC family response regulator
MSPGKRRASGELVRAYPRSRASAERELFAASRRARAILDQIGKLAPTMRPVLVCGETGTGKTLVAGLLHERSARGSLPLRVINCAALPDALLADVLGELDDPQPRGDQASAQESASVAKTLLLDEVGELSPWGQAVLLRTLTEENEKARFLSATHRDLDAMAAHGTFSRELLARLSVARILLPPLRERRDEVVPLALHFLRLALRAAGAGFISVDPELLECLERYDWPGNARELKNAMLRTLAVNDSGTLVVSDLPDAVRSGARGSANRAGP